MTVPSTARRAGPFTGTGALTSYPFTFKVFAATDLAVTVADEDGLESTLALDSSFLVTLNGDQETTPGGSVQYAVSGIATALPAGYSLAITGEGLEYEQTADLPQGGNFNPVVIENALDRQMMLTQLLRDVVTRALQLSVTTPAGVDATLPTPVANNFIGWDSGGVGLRNIDPNTLATIVAFASWQSETFNGTGAQTQFTLAADPGSIANTDVSVGGVTQRPNIDYTLSGLVIAFTVAPYAGTNNILVRYGQALPEGTSTLETDLANDSDVSKGDAKVATRLATASSKGRTQHDRNEEDPHLTDWDDTDETGATSSSTGLAAALASGRRRIYVPPGTFSLGSVVAATLTGELELYGPGRFVYTGANNTDNMVTVHCNGYGFSCIGPTFDGDEKSCGGLRISNNTDTFVEVNLKGCTFSDLRMNADAIWNNACYMAGAFRRVVIDGNVVRNVTRAAGTGTPGSNGTSGIDVQHEVATRYCKQCIHTNNVYENISGDDAAGSADNVDFDGFKFFVPNPGNFPNSDTTIYSYGQGSLVSHGNVYRNCRGRSIKVQGLANIHDEKIIRDADYTQTGGASEINLQYGAGTVRDIEFYYSDYLVGSTVTSPLQSGQALVGFFQGTWYNEESSSISVRGLKVINAVKDGVGEIIPYIVQCTTGTTPSTKNRPLIHISDISVNRGEVGWIFNHSADTGMNVLLRMDGISVAKLTYGAIGTNDFFGPSMKVIATGIMNIDGVTTPANAKKFITDTSPAGGNLGFAGVLEGHGIFGFTNTYNRGADENGAPLLMGAALAGPGGAGGLAYGGAASVQSVLLSDDASHTFDRRFYNSGRGLIIVSVNYDYVTQGVFAIGSNQIHQIAAPAGELFTPSTTGALVDTDGTLCLWFTGGALNIKNRLGGNYITTVMFIG